MPFSLALHFVVVAAVAGLSTAGFYFLRGYPLLLAVASGLALGAFAFLAIRTAVRLYRELTTPVMEVERSQDGGDEGSR